MIGCLLTIVFLVLACGVLWAFTCGCIYIITALFGIAFSWPAATGVWLYILIIGLLLRSEYRDH